MTLGVVNYGSGNFRSVWNALTHLGLDRREVTDAESASRASHLVLPGVGSFGACTSRLRTLGLDEVISAHIEAERPYLGICVGMQILGDLGTEFGRHQGLGAIAGTCTRMDQSEELDLPLPHIGWNTCTFEAGPLSRGLSPEPCFYFVHSYHLDVEDPLDLLATAEYGMTVTAAVSRGLCFGVQFHPEKSQRDGLRLLENFAKVT